LNLLYEQGWGIIIWTCRKDSPALRQWLKKHGIPFDTINAGLLNINGQSKKVFADVYIDDRNVDIIGEQYDWGKTYNKIVEVFTPHYRTIGSKLTIKRYWNDTTE
jgi:hypothetical protein